MEGAARIFLDGLEGASAGGRGVAKAALESAAEASAKEDAVAIRTASNALRGAEESEQVTNAFQAIMRAGAHGKEAAAALDAGALESLKLLRGSKLAEALTREEIESLQKIAAKVAPKFPDTAIQSAQRFVRSEEHALLDSLSSPQSRLLFNDTSFTSLAAAEGSTDTSVTRIIAEISAREPRFARAVKYLYTTAKVAVAGGAAGYCASWMVSFMKRNSGPFVTRVVLPDAAHKLQGKLGAKRAVESHFHRTRIRDPYPCGFRDKSGEENHPLDALIRRYAHDPCADWKSWDACGGWASTAARSRIASTFTPELLHQAMQTLNGATLSCEDATVKQAFVALVHDAGQTVGSALGASAAGVVEGLGMNFSMFVQIACALASVVAGSFAFTVAKSNGVSQLFSILIAFFVSALFFVLTQFLQRSKPARYKAT